MSPIVQNDMQNDHELIKDYQSGNRKAFDNIVKKYLSDTIGFFYMITGNRMASEDLAQDVFFKLFKSLKSFRFEASFSTFLYKVNLNTANTWFRRNKWKNLLRLDQVVEQSVMDNTVEKGWIRDELWNSIYKLPKKQRSVVIMRVSNKFSYKEISDITGMSVGAAKVNYHHAIKKLRSWIDNNE